MRVLESLGKTVIAAVVAAGWSASAQAADLVMKYSSWLPPTYWANTDIMNPWFAEIERVTEGRVKVETLPKAVGTPQSQLEVISDGLADIAFVVPGYTPGRFPVLGMAELPFFGTNEATVVAPAFHRTYIQHMAKFDEFAGTRLMGVWANGAGHAFTANKPISKVADFQGLKLRAAGPMTSKALEILDAAPIVKPATEIYEMLSTGVIDGGLNQLDSLKGTKMIELVNNGTFFEGGLFHAALAIVVNPAAWEKISPADQAAIEAISGEKLAELAGRAHDKVDGGVLEEIKSAKKITVTNASPEMTAELTEKLKPLEQAWVDGAKSAGLEDPAAVLAAFRADVKSKLAN